MAESNQNGSERPSPRRRKERGATAKKSATEGMRAGYAKGEERNRAAREALAPLAAGERPGAVTVGAILTSVLALVFWVSCVITVTTDAKVNGEEVNLVQLIFLTLIVTAMSWGMWRARYWAVLGFQMALALVIIAGVLGLVLATSIFQIIGTVLLVTGLSVLFWFMVKAMARIQMPDRPSGH